MAAKDGQDGIGGSDGHETVIARIDQSINEEIWA
jgi:hypothetical protein